MTLDGDRTPPRATGDWPMWRRDGRLTACQPLPGAMASAPRVLGRHFIGEEPGAATPADLTGTGAERDCLVMARARLTAWDGEGEPLWASHPPGYWLQEVAWVGDLDGDGRNEVVVLAGHLGGTRWAFLVLEGRTGAIRASYPFNQGQFGYSRFCGPYVKGRPGRQILLVTSGRQAEKGGWETHGRILLLAYDGETLAPVWEFEPTEYAIEYPSTLVGDLVGRGRLHGVVDSWCHVWNLDLATGDLVSHTTWDPQGANQRHYGWNQLTDVFGEGRLDYVNVSLTKHVDVLRCDQEGRLSLAWTRGWPDPVTTEARTLTCPADPVADLDGDGRVEIVAGLFEGLGDGRWHLMALDGRTGDLKAEIPDLCPIATGPLPVAPGRHGVYAARSRSRTRDPGEGCAILRIENGRWTALWTTESGSYLTTPVPSTETIHAAANGLDARRLLLEDVDGDGRREFFVQVAGRSQAWGVEDGGTIVPRRGSPPPPTKGPAPPRGAPGQGRMATYLLAADMRGRGRNHLLAWEGGRIREWMLEGETLRPGASYSSLEIPVVCRLLGDPRPFLLLAGRGEDRNLFVEALALEPDPGRDRSLWKYVFPDSGACGQYLQPLFFAVGHFTGPDHLDVFTYSTKPGARSYVLDGRDGHPVWERREIPGIERHFQAFGGRAAVWDFDGDGEDDILFCCPDYYCVADGRTGELLVGPVSLSTLTGRWAAYASPAILCRESKPPTIYLGGAYESRVGISADGREGLWSEFLTTDRWRLAVHPADNFGEGLLPPEAGPASKELGLDTWRVVQAQADGILVCFDAGTGRHRWEMPLTAAPSAIVAGDVDGDGRHEFVFGSRDGVLHALRDEGDRAREVWRMSFDGPVGTPLIADLNGDGKSELAVSVGDGHILVLG